MNIENPDYQDLLYSYIADPEHQDTNWNLAIYYHSIGQTATAVSFYIRTAERTNDTLLQYECLVRAGMCFETQGIRKFSVKGMLQHATALHPERPEAYYMLSMIQSNENYDGNWFDSFVNATLGVKIAKPIEELPKLRTTVSYPGKVYMEFQRAHTAWWCGLCDESRDLFRELYSRSDLPNDLSAVVKNNLIQLGGFYTKNIEYYDASQQTEFRHQFPGLESIEHNFSESYQDMFVLAMLNGKRDGTYLEIGSCQPFYGNNTALLELNFGWSGVSLDIDPHFVESFNDQRKNNCLLRDATTVDYTKFLPGLGLGKTIDYLQIDCDPPEVSYNVLLNMPLEEYKFAVITFEHDHYADDSKKYRELSRKYLESYGYKMVVNDIAPDQYRTYEDWWVRPDLINKKVLKSMTLINDDVKKAKDYMLGKL